MHSDPYEHCHVCKDRFLRITDAVRGTCAACDRAVLDLIEASKFCRRKP